MQTPMRTERERCMQAIERAGQGQCVALVCSGDAGIYGMAGLVLELLASGKQMVWKWRSSRASLRAVMAASVLGAPLMNDFCIISLSDLLTPAAVIRKRLAAAGGDFVICLYNPRSHTRTKPLDDALAILRSLLSPDTVVGIVRNAGRDGQSQWIGTLETGGGAEQVDMFCVMIVGNSATRVLDGRMVTARGYEKTGGEKRMWRAITVTVAGCLRGAAAGDQTTGSCWIFSANLNPFGCPSSVQAAKCRKDFPGGFFILILPSGRCVQPLQKQSRCLRMGDGQCRGGGCDFGSVTGFGCQGTGVAPLVPGIWAGSEQRQGQNFVPGGRRNTE